MTPRFKLQHRVVTACAACCAGMLVLMIGCAIPGQLVQSQDVGELNPVQNRSLRQTASSNLVVPAGKSQNSVESMSTARSAAQRAIELSGFDEPATDRTYQQVGYGQPVQDGSGFPQQAGDFQQASGYVNHAGYLQHPNPRVYSNPQGRIAPADALANDRMHQEMRRQDMVRQQGMQQNSRANAVQSYNPTGDAAVAPAPATGGYQPNHLRDSGFSTGESVSPPEPVFSESQQSRSNQYGGFSLPNRPYRSFDATESHRTHNGFLEYGPTMSGGTLNPFPRTATDHALELKADNDRLRHAEVRKNQELADKNSSLIRAQSLINERDQQLADARIRAKDLEKQVSRLSAQLNVAEYDKAEIKRKSDATLKSIESTLDEVLMQSISQK